MNQLINRRLGRYWVSMNYVYKVNKFLSRSTPVSRFPLQWKPFQRATQEILNTSIVAF